MGDAKRRVSRLRGVHTQPVDCSSFDYLIPSDRFFMALLSGFTTALLLAVPLAPIAGQSADTLLIGSKERSPVTAVTLEPARPDTLPAESGSDRASIPVSLLSVKPVGLSAFSVQPPRDTVPRRRRKAVVYSDAYGTRLMIHKTLSWAMLPLFAVSYVSGDQLIKKSGDAPDWARSIHPVAATSTAVLFGANTITGGWNLWDSRHDPNGRVRRYVHSALFLAASGGFAYTGTKLANDAQERQSKRNVHRNGALISMGVSTASWLIMLVGR